MPLIKCRQMALLWQKGASQDTDPLKLGIWEGLILRWSATEQNFTQLLETRKQIDLCNGFCFAPAVTERHKHLSENGCFKRCGCDLFRELKDMNELSAFSMPSFQSLV